MNKLKEWFNKPINVGICVAFLVIFMPYLSDKIKIGALIVGSIVLFEEIIRYIILGKSFVQILIMLLGLTFAIPLSIVLLIDAYLSQYLNYKIYFEILTAVALALFYITLTVNGYKQHIELRRLILIINIIIVACVTIGFILSLFV